LCIVKEGGGDSVVSCHTALLKKGMGFLVSGQKVFRKCWQCVLLGWMHGKEKGNTVQSETWENFARLSWIHGGGLIYTDWEKQCNS